MYGFFLFGGIISFFSFVVFLFWVARYINYRVFSSSLFFSFLCVFVCVCVCASVSIAEFRLAKSVNALYW
jgi:hypothetical protein